MYNCYAWLCRKQKMWLCILGNKDFREMRQKLLKRWLVFVENMEGILRKGWKKRRIVLYNNRCNFECRFINIVM